MNLLKKLLKIHTGELDENDLTAEEKLYLAKSKERDALIKQKRKQDYDNNLTILSLHGIRYKKLNDAIIKYEQSTTLYDHLKMRERDDRYEIIKDIETVCYDFLQNEYTIEEVLEMLSEMGPPNAVTIDKPKEKVDWAIRYANNVLLDSKDSDTGKK